MKKIVLVALVACGAVSFGFGASKEQCIDECQKKSDVAKCIIKCESQEGQTQEVREFQEPNRLM